MKTFMFFAYTMRYLVVARKIIHYSCEDRIEKSVLAMPVGDPRDGFFYPTLTLMMYYYTIEPLSLTVHLHFHYHEMKHNGNK